ncbi:class I SAM-dependent methyltransferase [Galbibacter sp. EGI 63066]|uniref:O-methyltransferase n=1 Tax=Galbibacter sp. EGI 63066 TaxID=2993559 RepID=UPI00224970A1|nr:class I SAM-dependent methyltransferase [Galbibacter sp. EGI 63066]MCX2680103.1 class I SAM-dependent methyltransferase [Galbibacter sp. EGI 63066]
MKDSNILDKPKIHSEIENKSEEIGFTMPSDLYIGSLLKTLITSKPKSNLLELGTGIGLSLSWMVDGMDPESKLITVDNDPKLIDIAKHYFGADKRVEIVCEDGTEWIKNYDGENFDLIFADAWPGKYSELDEVLELLNVGGFYIIDDMTAQPNWPDGHQKNVDQLIADLEKRKNLNLTKMNWSTGVIIVTKKY